MVDSKLNAHHSRHVFGDWLIVSAAALMLKRAELGPVDANYAPRGRHDSLEVGGQVMAAVQLTSIEGLVVALSLRESLEWTATWIVGPLLLMAMLIIGGVLVPARNHSGEDQEISRAMAFAAGIVGVTILIVRDVLSTPIDFPKWMTDSDNSLLFVVNFATAGFTVTLISSFFRTFATSSLLIFTLASVSVAAFYFYRVAAEVRGPVLISSTSLFFGVLICFWWVPASRRAVLE